MKQTIKLTAKQIQQFSHFKCNECHKVIQITHMDNFVTGYAVDKNDNLICYDCCGKLDERNMRETGKATLFLVKENDQYKLTNWPNTFSVRVHILRKGKHNMAGVRYDCWFPFNGYWWHGTQYGDNTELCHCKQTKEKVK